MLATHLTTVYVIRGLTNWTIQYYVSGNTEENENGYVNTEIWSQDIGAAKEFERAAEAESFLLENIEKCDTRYEIVPIIKQEWR